jgi:hypothetical protein
MVLNFDLSTGLCHRLGFCSRTLKLIIRPEERKVYTRATLILVSGMAEPGNMPGALTRTEQPPNTLLDLPEDVLLAILSHLPCISLVQTSAVSLSLSAYLVSLTPCRRVGLSMSLLILRPYGSMHWRVCEGYDLCL